MVWIDPWDSFSCSSSRLRTRLSEDSAVEIRRNSRASSRIAATSPSRRLRRSRRWRATSACRKTTFSSANTPMNATCPGKAPADSGVAEGPNDSTASKPTAAAASGRPTDRRWNVTRKLTTAYTSG